MMPRLQAPSIEGLTTNPELTQAVAAIMGRLLPNLQTWGEKIYKEVQKDISVATPDGMKGLAELAKGILRKGAIVAFHISWSEAMAMKGWAICDGRNGTPQMHPHPTNGGSQRFIRASVWGCSVDQCIGGIVGGTTSHLHHICFGSGGAHGHTITVTISEESAHDHCGNTGTCNIQHTHEAGTLCASACTTEGNGCYGTGGAFCHSYGNHFHDIEGATGGTTGGDTATDHTHTIQCAGAHCHGGSTATVTGLDGTHTHEGDTDLSGAGASTSLPPYVDEIYMMKL